MTKKETELRRNNIVFKSIAFGIAGAIGLFLFYYIVLYLVTKDPAHPINQMKLYQPWMSLLILGFGIQTGLYYLLRKGVRFRISRGDKREAGAITGTGATVSGVSMAACCAHHIVDVLPVLGISGAALFLTEYQKELLMIGVLVNVLGILYMFWVFTGKKDSRAILNLFVNRKEVSI